MSEDRVKSNNNDGQEMSFWAHLDVLRANLIRILIFISIAFVIWFIVMPNIFDVFILGATNSNFFLYKWLAFLGRLPFIPDFTDQSFHVDIINIHVASQFMTHMSISFYMAVLTAVPYIIFEIWKFIAPALLPNEKKQCK